MNELVGVAWGDLSDETKEDLFQRSSVWEDVTDGDCIYDLTETLSVAGHVKCINAEEGDYEYTIDDNAIIYNSSEGIILEPKKNIKFEINEVMTVNEAAEIWNKSEGAIRAAIKAKKFILGVDYRKAGRITLITRNAMENVYGKQ